MFTRDAAALGFMSARFVQRILVSVKVVIVAIPRLQSAPVMLLLLRTAASLMNSSMTITPTCRIKKGRPRLDVSLADTPTLASPPSSVSLTPDSATPPTAPPLAPLLRASSSVLSVPSTASSPAVHQPPDPSFIALIPGRPRPNTQHSQHVQQLQQALPAVTDTSEDESEVLFGWSANPGNRKKPRCLLRTSPDVRHAVPCAPLPARSPAPVHVPPPSATVDLSSDGGDSDDSNDDLAGLLDSWANS